MATYAVISTEALIEKFKYALENDWGYIWGTAGVMWTKAKQEQLEKTTDADRESGRKLLLDILMFGPWIEKRLLIKTVTTHEEVRVNE